MLSTDDALNPVLMIFAFLPVEFVVIPLMATATLSVIDHLAQAMLFEKLGLSRTGSTSQTPETIRRVVNRLWSISLRF